MYIGSETKAAIKVLEEYPEIESTSELKKLLNERLQSENSFKELLSKMPVKILGFSNTTKKRLLFRSYQDQDRIPVIETIGQLAEKKASHLYRIYQFGNVCMNDITTVLKQWHLGLQMSHDEVIDNIRFPEELFDTIVDNYKYIVTNNIRFVLSYREEKVVDEVLNTMAKKLNKEPVVITYE